MLLVILVIFCSPPPQPLNLKVSLGYLWLSFGIAPTCFWVWEGAYNISTSKNSLAFSSAVEKRDSCISYVVIAKGLVSRFLELGK